MTSHKDTFYDPEAAMQKISLRISVVALSLMIGGLIAALVSDTTLTSDTAAVPFSTLLRPWQISMDLTAMSAGILLLALLPGVRVALAVWLYIRRHALLDVFVGLVVLLELLLSILH
jgi:hypothetical protein